MKLNIKFIKNLSFALIIAIGIFYFSSLIILLQKLLDSCVALFISVYGFDRHTFTLLMSTPKTYLNLFGMVLIAILLFKFIRSAFKQIIKIYKTKKYVENFEFEKIDGINVITSDDYTSFTAGIISPEVYISKNLLSSVDDNEYKSIKFHELKHKNDKDPLRNVVVDFIKEALPFGRIIKALFTSYDLVVELSADFFAHERVEKKYTISALFKTLSETNDLNLSKFNSQSERIKILTNEKKFNVSAFVICLVFFCVLMVSNLLMISKVNAFNNCNQVENCFLDIKLENGQLMSKEIGEICRVKYHSIDQFFSK